MRILGSTVAIAMMLALVGCADDEPEVDWSNYTPSLKGRIDDAAQDEDCDALRQEFDAAEANDSAQRKFGDGNADLMDYIDHAMEEAGC